MIPKSQMVFLEHNPFATLWSCCGRKPKDNRRLNVSYSCRSLLLIAVTDLRHLLSVSGPDSPVLFADLGCVLSTRNSAKAQLDAVTYMQGSLCRKLSFLVILISRIPGTEWGLLV